MDLAYFSLTNFHELVDFSFTELNEIEFGAWFIVQLFAIMATDKLGGKLTTPFLFSSHLFTLKAYFNSTKFRESQFIGAQFQKANFYQARFDDKVDFNQSAFQEANFSKTSFKGQTNFNFVIFENGEKILFDVDNLSKVSFMNTDITRVRFGASVDWNEGEYKRVKIADERKLEEILNNHNNDDHKVVEEKLKKLNIIWHRIITVYRDLRKKIIRNNKYDEKKIQEQLEKSNIRLGGIITVYRSLRENYEYSFRYEEADRFFISEMEVKRNYREKKVDGGKGYLIKQNGGFRRNLSLTGLYHILLNYGQDYIRSALIALAVVLALILYSLVQVSLIDRNLTFQALWNAIVENLRNIFAIDPQQGVPHYFIGIATVSILGGLFIPALKRKFEKKFRH